MAISYKFNVVAWLKSKSIGLETKVVNSVYCS